MDGVEGLIAAIKYEPAGSTFTVQDENANSNFLNNNVLSTLSLYKMNYKITHIVSSGLTSKNETTRRRLPSRPLRQQRAMINDFYLRAADLPADTRSLVTQWIAAHPRRCNGRCAVPDSILAIWITAAI